MDIDHIIGLYLNDQASDEQLVILKKWVADSRENAEALKRMEEVWQMPAHNTFYFNENEVGERVLQRLKKTPSRKRYFFIPRNFLRSTGVFLLLASLSFLLYNGMKNDVVKQNELAQKEEIHYEPIIKTNPKGIKSTIGLPDGSTVVLNAESSLKYNFKPGDSIRYVELEGEAFFKVMKNADKPFVVQAGNVRTIALGTEFNIKSYAYEQMTDVSLSEGKVKVAIGDLEAESYILNPGQNVIYDYIKDSSLKSTFKYKKVIGWTKGYLTFEKDSLQQVLVKLSRWYDVDFELKNYHGIPWKYTGEFQDEYLDVILKSMSYSQHFDYEISKGNVLIKFKN